MALCLHYLLLSAFCWMLVEGCHIYRLLTDVFRSLQPLLANGQPVTLCGRHKQLGVLPYHLLGYGLPLVVVLPSLATSQALGLGG